MAGKFKRGNGKAFVFGISPQDTKSKAKFAEKESLNYPVLADIDSKICEKYGVWAEKSMYGRKYMGIVRSAFVIDEAGKLAGVFYKVSPKDTVPKAMEALKG